MKVDRIKWNIKGFQELRKSAEVQAELKRRADAIASACGEGIVANTSIGKTRARAVVIAVTPEAIRSNAKNNIILNNLDRGRS